MLVSLIFLRSDIAKKHHMIFASNPYEIVEFIRPKFSPDVEELWALAINAQGKVIKDQMLFRGTVDVCPCHPRDIFRFAILQNASAFILIHNHPSGATNPSAEDIDLTHKIYQLSQMMGIEFLDHIILTDSDFASLKTLGLLNKKRKRIIALQK